MDLGIVHEVDVLTCGMKDCFGFPSGTETTKCNGPLCIKHLHTSCATVFGREDDELYCSNRCAADKATTSGLAVRELLHPNCHEEFEQYFARVYEDDNNEDIAPGVDEDFGITGPEGGDEDEDGSQASHVTGDSVDVEIDREEEKGEKEDIDLSTYRVKASKPHSRPQAKKSTNEDKKTKQPRKVSEIIVKRLALLNKKCILSVHGKPRTLLITNVLKQKVPEGTTKRGNYKYRIDYYVDLQTLDGVKEVFKMVPEERVSLSLLPQTSAEMGGALMGGSVMPPRDEVETVPRPKKHRLAVSAIRQVIQAATAHVPEKYTQGFLHSGLH